MSAAISLWNSIISGSSRWHLCKTDRHYTNTNLLDGGKDSSQKPRRSLRQTLFHSSVIRNILWWNRFALRRDRQHCWR
jgi:hypothetical protein